MPETNWIKIENTEKLSDQGRMIFRHQGKQILLIQQGDHIFAVNNRCPHEGFPLSEGSLSQDCTLTCNWHNWKFDLSSGETVVGGDTLRHYPLRRDNEGLWVDVQDAPEDQRQQKALGNIQASFQRYEYDRMARELGRLKQAGGTYVQAVADSIMRNYDRFEYGMNHAFAAAADWLSLGTDLEGQGRDDEALAAVLEIISHIAWDCQRQKCHPFPEEARPYDAEVLKVAIEQEDEQAAVAYVRGALSAGLTYPDLEPALAAAALAHYNDFGHSAIYVYKAGQLIDALGPEVTLPLVLALVRHLIYASREDLIPEFRRYGPTLAGWDATGNQPITAQDLQGLSVNKTLARMAQSSAHPEQVFEALHHTLARNMLYIDLAWDRATDHGVAQNVGWFTFTHGLTFANAVRILCGRYPDLWPQGLLQMGCFSGRNAKFTDWDQDISQWQVTDAPAFFETEFGLLVDHANPEPIVGCHRLKVLTAVREDVAQITEGEARDSLLASVNRYLNSPLKRRHSLRTAKQARQFVLAEG